ncbi:hypothetical protein BGZ60DRAFT_260406 [Tricladium varicosporioides]|nr:hypothetical protein BGZ60DRAFT_260406 [Hymenoscyphus varicosporioides]
MTMAKPFADSMESEMTEPVAKRQKVCQNDRQQAMQVEHDVADDIGSNKPGWSAFDSSFTFKPSTTKHASQHDFILDITNYIPAGCLRIYKSHCTPSIADIWSSHTSWHAFAHPQDVYSLKHVVVLPNVFQEALFDSPALSPYRGLHIAGWIRGEFQALNDRIGQARIYILPDDVGRTTINRQSSQLRRAMQLLVAQLDIGIEIWMGNLWDDIPVAHVDSSLNEDAPKDDASLFQIFNTLPTPNPQPDVVVDSYASEAMEGILSGRVEGLRTTMHQYQRRSAALMLQREAQPAQVIDPRLRVLNDQLGNKWYCDADAGLCLQQPRTYEAPKGGICAETMGLGKTLICLALILATRDISSQIPVEYSVGTIPVRKSTGSLKEMCAATVGRTGTPWKQYFAKLKADGVEMPVVFDLLKQNPGYYYLPAPVPRRESRNPVYHPPRKIWLTGATIVVVPANLVVQWHHEIDKHTEGLKVLTVLNNKTPLPPAQELSAYDIILFSKPRFEKEARDGSDAKGRRRSTTSRVCRCSYIGATRERDCACFNEDEAYHSPLKDLHFKRLITDEGHTFGNASKNTKTEAATVLDLLQLDARWIVSGTPTQGLYGVEVGLTDSGSSSNAASPLPISSDESIQDLMDETTADAALVDQDAFSISSSLQERLFQVQERKDLEKLGNIATVYLKARPWANTLDDGDMALWAHHVMQPRHGSKSRGSMDCLRSTLEGMIIRHRPEDVSLDVTLPPLKQDVIYLDGSLQDKLSLNKFSMMIVSNAVTSERRDADYLFHSRQRAALQELVSNLRQASFHWSGYKTSDVMTTLEIAKNFLDKGEVKVSQEDESLLREAISVGEMIVSNKISNEVSESHEMPMYLKNEWPEDIRRAWSLDIESTNPLLMGTTMVHQVQKFVSSQSWKEDPTEGMIDAGHRAFEALEDSQNTPTRPRRKSADISTTRKLAETAPTLAGGVAIGKDTSPKKLPRSSSSSGPRKASVSSLQPKGDSGLLALDRSAVLHSPIHALTDSGKASNLKSALKKAKQHNIAGAISPASCLANTTIISTGSAKLSYLMDKIVIHHVEEKILVFYEADNVAYYIAQALECLGIKHLIYAKSLSSTRRAQYVATFNQTEIFRVLLMDVSQAAFGLDMSSASRVFFVNPVFSPQVEAQAVKRAHRIGQTRPVFVETLVLKGSIEEVILERRKNMSNEEHNKCKTILDDETMYDWIRNVRFLSIQTDGVAGPDQMAKLAAPQPVFMKDSNLPAIHDPDADLVMQDINRKATIQTKGKGKQQGTGKRIMFDEPGEDDSSSSCMEHKPKRARFNIPQLISSPDETADERSTHGFQFPGLFASKHEQPASSSSVRSPRRTLVSDPFGFGMMIELTFFKHLKSHFNRLSLEALKQKGMVAGVIRSILDTLSSPDELEDEQKISLMDLLVCSDSYKPEPSDIEMEEVIRYNLFYSASNKHEP